MKYIDFHCDSLMVAYLNNQKDIYDMPDAMLDLKRLNKSGATAQFFAIFLRPGIHEKLPFDDRYTNKLIGIYENTINKYPHLIAKATNIQDIQKNEEEGKISAFLTIEDGRIIRGRFDNLINFYKKGVRLITLTWNGVNCFGYPNSPDRKLMAKGLKPFGKEAITAMNSLGMLIDVSHLSDGGFYDVAAISKKPFIASHSNCRSISPHPRNMTDDMIHVLGNSGGVMGLNFAGQFLNEDINLSRSTLEKMGLHIKHILNLGGEDSLAIGTDFDGIENDLEISSPDKMYMLFDYLKSIGVNETQLEKMASKNAKRIIKDVLN